LLGLQDPADHGEKKALSLAFFRTLLEQMKKALTGAPFSYHMGLLLTVAVGSVLAVSLTVLPLLLYSAAPGEAWRGRRQR
jgi:hypothetical protein